MNTTAYGESFLLHQFHEFYSEVIRLKHLVQSGTWTFLAETPYEGGIEPSLAVQHVRQRLCALLADQVSIGAQRSGDFGSVIQRESQYIMAVFADEIFVHLPWEGQTTWQANALESQFFQTHDGSERFFDKLEQLLHTRDPAYTEVAAVYLRVLGLGFRGKFWGTDDAGQLAHYRQQLFAFVFHHNPALGSNLQPLFPDAYAHTLTEERGTILPQVWKWVVALAVVVVWCGVASRVW
ncbi:MAG: DotU family type IV/VI secretion system protein, partial [Candidatus Tectomicrobia bacterium]|nr:DotU family type IV/VI secretion system protein [Candidatus Tectomicrobia bacterium]